MRARVLAGALLLAASCGPSCSIRHTTAGRALPSIDGLEIGRSRKADVLRQLGAPASVRRQHDGDLFIYRRTESRYALLRLVPYLVIYERSRACERADQIVVLFDSQGTLAGIGLEREVE